MARALRAGVKLPMAAVSVMPQPSLPSEAPDTAWNRSWISTGSGAPPELHNRKARKIHRLQIRLQHAHEHRRHAAEQR